MVGLIKRAKLIIWDDAPMTNMFYVEALDRSLRVVMRGTYGGESDKPFGGRVVVCGGDFRRILRVVHGEGK